MISEEARKRVNTRNAMHATFLVDGEVAGAWRLGPDRTVQIEPFRPLTATEREEVDAEAARLVEFAAPAQNSRR